MATRKIRGPSIKAPDGKNDQVVLSQLKEALELGQRLRGNPLDSFVRVSELVEAGLLQVVDGKVLVKRP